MVFVGAVMRSVPVPRYLQSSGINTPTDTTSDKRRSESGFLHPARGMTANYTAVRLTERYWG